LISQNGGGADVNVSDGAINDASPGSAYRRAMAKTGSILLGLAGIEKLMAG
jgi:hypothetical protein